MKHRLNHLDRSHVVLPQDMLLQAKLIMISLAELGHLVSRCSSQRFLLGKFDTVNLILAFQVLQSRVGWDVASPDASRIFLAVNGHNGQGRLIAQENSQSDHPCRVAISSSPVILKTSIHKPEGPAPITTASIGFSSVEPAVPEHTCLTVKDFLLAIRRFIFAEDMM